ncbi:MAG: putative sulfate exporter family transporter [Gammaproteobacteria bacterium]|nr:putative sulfate exporter family transporter [Gammaproteobacteria bacterium]MDH4316353.1 putative sulfate exporter family transporter [Gammaproteobacteria bacterium]MDH5215482.1 putative sulfate exporter family transporter [Gammaproteobacteria bacterium]MDH5501533.1 putative sulfate exporter family transporter [Gammaproteobacteria bacterium]
MNFSAVARTVGTDCVDGVRSNWSGILLAAVIAIAATFISDTRGGPTLLYALLLGMALHSVSVDGKAKSGIDFAARRILRLGVTLLGARITLEQLSALGWINGSLIVAGVVATIGFGVALSRLIGVDRRLGLLTGGATAICGASAAIAIASVLAQDETSERELIFTVAGVTVLSTFAMILYPAIVAAFGLMPDQAGIFLGGTIHDVAQVVGAGYSVSQETGDYAVLTKMLRVAMLLPVVMALSVVMHRGRASTGHGQRDPLLPRFLVGFVALVIAGSLGWIPASLGTALTEVSRACLVIAIAGVGLKTSLLEIRKVGSRAALLLGAEALFLVVFVLLVQHFH